MNFGVAPGRQSSIVLRGIELLSMQPVVNEVDLGMDEIYEVLSRRFRSGHHDTAQRHNEHL